MSIGNKQVTIILLALIGIGTLLRFYNLDWGAPYFFHPDERNMAFSISQLSFPDQLNPNFFAYGSLPIYAIYLSGLLSNIASSCFTGSFTCLSAEALAKVGVVSFEQSILISRIFSAVFSLALIPLLFLIGKKLYGDTAGLLTAALATFSVGFIQFAHFGTTEMWLTFFSLLFFYLLLLATKKLTGNVVLLLGIIGGILVATKVSSAVVLILPLPVFYWYYRKHISKTIPLLLKTGLSFLLFLWITSMLYVLTNPYVLLDTTSFLNSMRYESTLATGSLPVFYTQEFFGTIPVIYQLTSIYPFLITPVLTLFFIPALLSLMYHVFRKPNTHTGLLLLIFFLLFFSQAFLFVKWTRYMVPTVPFIYLILTGAVFHLRKQYSRTIFSRLFLSTVLPVLLLISGIFAGSFFYTVYATEDTRVSAATFASEHLSHESSILSEVYDLGIIPFNDDFPETTLFNFYELDAKTPEANPERLTMLIDQTDYIILPSQRLMKTRLLQEERFPLGHRFYTDLNAEVGYRKLYETSCDIFCRIAYMGDPVFSYEGTASVFDRPTVMIYQKL